MNDQLRELARPFPENQIERKPGKGGGDYVTHSVVNERLLYALGPFDFHLVEIIRGDIAEMKTKSTTYPARTGIVGVVARLSVTIDGRTVSVEEVGSEDNPAMKHDAENLKSCMSDALKRAAMRLGLGLHLWSQEMYFLDRALGQEAPKSGREPASGTIGDEPEFPPDPPEGTFHDETATKSQLHEIASALTAAGLDKKQMLGFTRWSIDREIGSAAELTRKEADRLLKRWASPKGGVSQDVVNDAIAEWQADRQMKEEAA